MSISTQLLTAQEFFKLGPERSELVDGEIHPMAPVGGGHGYRASRLAVLLTQFADGQHLGKIFIESGFILRRNPDTVRGPDISFVCNEALKRIGGIPDDFFTIPPDLAVEVLSPSDTMRVAADKARQYLAAGTQLVWIVDPQRQTVTVYTPTGTPLTLLPTDTLDGGTVLPGLNLPISEIFA